MYHWEADQEDFLVLDGEALLIVEGEERPLRAWDFVHCPPETKHVIVGAGDAPCLVLAVGARDKSVGANWGGYTVDEAAAKHGASVDEDTTETAGGLREGREAQADPHRRRLAARLGRDARRRRRSPAVVRHRGRGARGGRRGAAEAAHGRSSCTAARGASTIRTSSRTSPGSRRQRGSCTWICPAMAARTGVTRTPGASKHAPTRCAGSATPSGCVSPIVYGHSLGGMVAMLYGVRHPGHARLLVLVSTAGRFDVHGWWRAFAARGGDEVAEISARAYLGEPVTDEEWARCRELFGPNVPDAETRARLVTNEELGELWSGRLGEFDVLDQLGAIESPTLVCVGELDPVTPVAAAEELAAAVPGARLEVLARAGHWPWLDAPERHWELLADVLAESP